MDVGHLILHGQPLDGFYRCFASAIDIIHLHGATRTREHLAADRLPPDVALMLLPIIADFPGVVSLEVFNASDLTASLDWLSAHWDNPPATPEGPGSPSSPAGGGVIDTGWEECPGMEPGKR
jgi:hypothetical protein